MIMSGTIFYAVVVAASVVDHLIFKTCMKDNLCDRKFEGLNLTADAQLHGPGRCEWQNL